MKIALPPKLLKLLNTAYTAFTAYTAYTASTAYINAHGIWQFGRNLDEHKMGIWKSYLLLYFKDNDKISCAIS